MHVEIMQEYHDKVRHTGVVLKQLVADCCSYYEVIQYSGRTPKSLYLGNNNTEAYKVFSTYIYNDIQHVLRN